MRPLALWRHEFGRAGWITLVAPPLALLAPLALTALGGAERQRLLLAGPEAVLPLAVALAAVSIVARDPVTELHLTLPTRLRATLLRRLALLLLVAGIVAGLYCALLIVFDAWAGPRSTPLPQSLLLWSAPTLALTAVTVAVGGLTRSLTLATTTAGGLWLVEQLFAGVFTEHVPWLYLFPTLRLGVGPDWTASRLTLLAVALVVAVGAAWTLGRPERLLTEEDR
ncbi:hypothetical protein [Cryptosporangium arvum]|uniref:ABC-2 family transporter protein n=1 Tax=Cryptosporangium arvum DSM 44712 TaxID=927661 RepID=A0A011AK57_9ACTN|nr:hypothetical protein [Cryptosporangium arvum]EXG82356.1 hypothetical protein CryarDRAFT_3532 [Cryptosporangium arvum DSM 44712]